MPRRLNSTLADAYVSDEIWSAVREAEANTETIVRESIDTFKKQLQEKAEELKNDKTVAQFDAEVAEIQKRMDADIKGVSDQLTSVKTSIADVTKKLNDSKATNAQLKKATGDLNKAVKELETELSEFEKKLSGFGESTGRFLVGQVTGRILGI